MNFWSFKYFEKYTVEPGSYIYRTRFLWSLKITLPGICMGTWFLHIQNPVLEYKIPQFLKINTGNPVPPHREPVPTYCRTKICCFDSIYAFQTILNHSYTNYTFRNTKIQPLYIITTSYNIVSSFLLIIRHTNDLNSIIRHN